MSSAAIFESLFPASPQAPQIQRGPGAVDLAPGGVRVGTAGSPFSRVLADALPSNTAGAADEPTPGAVFAQAGGAGFDIGIPYLPRPGGGIQLSPVGVHLDGVNTSAVSLPGKAVELAGHAAGGYVSIAGEKVADIPPGCPPNTAIRIPEDPSRPPVALLVVNEQVTTDSQGRPTLGKDGKYAFDPEATSGYVNVIHMSVLGNDVAEVTIGHAAVIRITS
ncbi:hypothetical protein [Streptomyces virginiae]|uniref:hypothetical protein n=1 Tax=Streptomyces virginiae TaxID=1961 RepID=UPI00224E5CB5|nr:hypothetical protein [Streptomyces virginiae]MCX5174597.1 hypothetical protein [Streptomyces virginiae]